MINERLKELRGLMQDKGLDAYLVPTADPHQSEYIADHYKTREYISGFTGSQGTAVITMDKAILWTDGRYFIQAEDELAHSEFVLYKMGNPDYPTLIEFLNEEIEANGKIGFCGETLSYSSYRKLLENTGTRLLYSDLDFVGDIWKTRPALPKGEVFIHDDKYSGLSAQDKIGRLRGDMEDKGIDYYLISKLDECSYLYNIRGTDIAYNPVCISYGIVSKDKALLFIDQRKLDDEVREYLSKNHIEVRDYEEIFTYMEELPARKSIFFDPDSVNIALINRLKSSVRLIKNDSLVEKYKAIKTETEIKNAKEAFIKDSVALVKFFNWLETGVPTGVVTEVLASNKLLNLREEGEGFVDLSFETISAYGPNAAMPHYSPKNKGDELKPRGLYLVDSGGQYLEGTTDITRTLALGDLTEDEIFHYTMTLKSHIALASAYFKEGSTGYYLDAFAKYPLLKEKLDFDHGTGHGVGFFLNVHEGPQNISFRKNNVEMEKGMVVSIEPGIYIEGSHGIRIENIVVVEDAGENDFGHFYKFDLLSYVPIDTRPVDVSLLSDDELNWLNSYNKMCYEKLSPYLEDDDLAYLERSTKEVTR